ncbi:Tat pathway signal sequence domain protein [Oesophagostomum dentatum]|uniref:Tat pathway signal sequence domain protein n=1 Tax=Oesophagostomum dentatum TaxID=61180 RepID=A0A0B1SZ02_OESDE|nr:Tat pathway signal sequence domain protein [Oesophagostomum dentatum]
MEDSAVYKSLIYEPSPPKKSSLPPLRLQLTAILVALGGPFNFGYQLLITNPAQEAFLQFLNDSHYLNKNEALEREQLEDPVSRRGTLVGAVVMASMAMSGIAAINAFAFEILLSTGLNVLQASIGNIIICIMSVLGILTSSFIIDRFGRRVLLLSTYSLLAVINVFIAAFMLGFEHFQISALGYPLLCTICMFNFVFAAGPGPVSLFITGELVGQHARGAACTWANVCMCLLRSLLTASYLPLKNLIGQPISYFLLFFPPVIFAVFLLYFYLPETKGKTPVEVEEEWENLPKMCKSRSHSGDSDVNLKVLTA